MQTCPVHGQTAFASLGYSAELCCILCFCFSFYFPFHHMPCWYEQYKSISASYCCDVLICLCEVLFSLGTNLWAPPARAFHQQSHCYTSLCTGISEPFCAYAHITLNWIYCRRDSSVPVPQLWRHLCPQVAAKLKLLFSSSNLWSWREAGGNVNDTWAYVGDEDRR